MNFTPALLTKLVYGLEILNDDRTTLQINKNEKINKSYLTSCDENGVVDVPRYEEIKARINVKYQKDLSELMIMQDCFRTTIKECEKQIQIAMCLNHPLIAGI